ncbi:unnamed protein product [Symbiodinium necroappetens]|uniref:Calcineurin-like phosphoesterase domain-containing protein n=1 Tax=Symbiodinium necroappetens TaxID=1628268 RepID=A0A813A1I5_9DINO|nr:unnamed protein product [Symbiodinium necroappetens]
MLPTRRLDSHNGTGHDGGWSNESHMNFTNAMISARCLMVCPGLRDLDHQVDGLHDQLVAADYSTPVALADNVAHYFSAQLRTPRACRQMAKACLKHAALIALGRLALAEETLESLGIGPNSRLASLFDSSDVNADGQLSGEELQHFEENGNDLLRGNALLQHFEVTLFEGADCSGQSLVVQNSSSEQRCSACFDVCNKEFSAGSAMSTVNGNEVWSVASNVRSLRVDSGAAKVVLNLCLGTYNYGVAGNELTAVHTVRDGCLNFGSAQAPAHVSAVPLDLLELATGVFLKADVDPFDDRLDSAEAAHLDLDPLIESADRNGDGVMSIEEYTTLLVHDLARQAAMHNFMSAESMREAALAAVTAQAQGSTDHVTEAQRDVEAQRMFGTDYQQAVDHPAEGVPQPVERGPNGEVIVSGGPDGSDYGDVRDASPVSGSYDPQQAGDVMMCVDGKDFQAGFCYNYCKMDYPVATLNMCWKKDCPSGWREIAGGMCKKNGFNLATKAKEHYNRGMGVRPSTCRLGDSFGPGANPDNGNRDFTVVMVSDTQLPWCSGDFKSDVDCAVQENWRLVQGIHDVSKLTWVTDGNGTSQEVAEPLGVFITGDLTAYAHNWQFRLYRQIWETRAEEDRDKNIKLPVWPGLGNHDYANNLEGCWWVEEELTWTGYGKNSCAQRMVAYMRAAVAKCGGQTVVNNFGGHVDHYDKDSAAYTVRYGRIRFVHLHNYPTYRRRELTGVASTMDFLKDEVAEAERTKDYLVLLIHDVNGHFAPWDTDDQVDRYSYFSEVVAGSRTIAVFSGHFHPIGGMRTGTWAHLRDSRTQEDLVNAFGESVPSLRGYAPDYSAFLVTQWNVARCFWRFGSVQVPRKDQPRGDPSWKSPQDENQQNTFQIPDCTVDIDYQPANSMMVSSSSIARLALSLSVLMLASVFRFL